jgi:hypothetical protein
MTATYDSTYLENMKDSIEKMTKQQQLDVLRILKKNQQIKLNENKSGIYVNISFLPKETAIELDKYIKYVKEQETQLSELEIMKEEYKNKFFPGMAIGNM